MYFKSLKIRNFLSFGDKEQQVQLDKQGLVLLSGINKDDPNTTSNGSGKSSLIDALIWCLYGVTLRGYEGDDVINLRTGKNCSVELYLESKSSVYLISRSRKLEYHAPSTLQVIQVGSFVGHPGVDLTKSSIRETQEYLIENVLGMRLNTFLNVVVFGQTRQYRFALLSDAEQKELLEDTLSLQTYVQAYKKAKDVVDVLQERRNKARDLLRYTENTLRGHVQDQEEYVQAQASFDANKAKNVKIKARELRSLQGEHVGMYNPVNPDKYKEDQETLKNVTEQYQYFQNRYVQSSNDFYRAEQEYKKVVEKRQQLKDHCPTCGQKTSATVEKEWVAKTNTAYDERQEALKIKNSDQENLDHFRKEKNKREAAVQEQTDLLTQYNSDKSRIVQQITQAKIALQTAQDQVSPYQELLSHLERTIIQEQRKIQRLQQRINKLDRSLEYYNFWLQAFSSKGIRPMIIATALPELNALVSEYIADLTEGNTKIEFNTQSVLKSGKTIERFSVDVCSKYGASTYAGHSAGERAKIDLCIGLALQTFVIQRTGISSNISFFDEITESLDDSGTEKVLDLITRIASKRESVFIITHIESFKALIPGSLVVQKKYGESTIQQ